MHCRVLTAKSIKFRSKLGFNQYDKKRQKALEKEIGCEFIRINPDEKYFNLFKAINEIHRQIKKLTEKSTKKSLIHEL